VKDFAYPQFTGHTVSSPYSYIPAAPSATPPTTTETQTAPQAPAPKHSTPAPTPPALPLTPTPPQGPPTTTIGGNGQ
jgi:hypothetical protein